MFLTECKKMLNVELESLKTCMYQVSSTAKNFEVPEPYPSQKGNLGKQFEETIVEFIISTLQYLFEPSFI